MNPELRNLIALQDLDTKISLLQKQVSDIPNQSQILNAELQRIKDAHQERVAHVKELANNRRTLEGQVEMNQSKLSRLKDQLMAVKTNKEYTAMLHEIQIAEDQIRHEEDKILEFMEEMEGEDHALKEAEKEMRQHCAEIEGNIRKANDSIPQLEAELAGVKEGKAAMELQIDADLLARYRRIAEARKGIALAEAVDELCSACHVRIRPQMYADLLRTEVIQYCDSCSRILFSRKGLEPPVCEK